MGSVTYETLEHVAMEARPYPSHLLKGCRTGLVLFAAGFLGHNDAIHFAEAGIETHCVDADGSRIAQMRDLYPSEWCFYCDDAWRAAQNWSKYGTTFDAVSCDTWTGDLMNRSLDSLELWCSLARKVVTVTIDDSTLEINVPDGWTSSLYPRSDHVSWLVLTRD